MASTISGCGGLGADYKKAKEVSVTVGGWAWDGLYEGPFERAVKDLDESNLYKQDISRSDRFVIGKALRVSGMVAELEFSSDVAAELNPKYKGPIAELGTGEVALEVATKWTSNTTLRIESKADFYLAGELYTYDDTGFAGPGDLLTKIDLAGKIQVGVDDTLED